MMQVPPIVSLDTPLAPLTSWRIGGAAQYLVRPRNESDLVEAIEWARHNHLPVSPLGRGTNVLVSDGGVSGLVVLISDGPKQLQIERDSGTIRADAATPLPRIAVEAVAHSISGLETFVGIPGTVGGAVAMNAGTGGRSGPSISDVLVDCRVYDLSDGQIRTVSAAELRFGYRYSVVRHRPWIVLSATFRGSPDADTKALQASQKRILRRRRDTQPLRARTAGSVVLQPLDAQPAGWYLEQSGLKGYRLGGAEFSRRHANWIENTADAKASDVLALIQLAEKIVEERFGLSLEREVQLLPKDDR